VLILLLGLSSFHLLWYIFSLAHRGVIHVSFRDDDRLQQFLTGMHEEGFSLPDDVPDATFKVPDWMKHE
jgi:hypothetical protein